MPDEIAKIVEVLNKIQEKALCENRLTKQMRAEWRLAIGELRARGYNPKKHKEGKTIVWRAETFADSKNSESGFIYTNMRPADGKRTLKGDCTTRALAFCLDGLMTYREIERRQYDMGERFGTRRNNIRVWISLIEDFGYVNVRICGKPKRSVIGNMLAEKISSPIMARSSGHVSVIDQMGNIRDIWDCRGGRCDTLVVNRCDISAVMDALADFSPEEVVDFP